MARSEGMALAPWGALGQGRIRSDKEEQRRKESGEEGRRFTTATWERDPDEVRICRKLEEIAKEVGTEYVTAVALAYLMHVRSLRFVTARRLFIRHFRKRHTFSQS